MKRSRLRILIIVFLAIIGVLVAGTIASLTRDRALVAALEAKDGLRVRQLLAEGADPNTVIYVGPPEWMEKVLPGLILNRLYSANYFPGAGDSVLEYAVESELDTATILALIEYGASVNVSDGYGGTPLIKAASAGQTAVVKALVARGADVNACIGHYGPWTALMGAVKRGDVESVRILLERGADPNVKRRGGDSLLRLAQGKTDIQKLLKKAGAKW